MTHIIEQNGEVLPAYTGVNQPIYPKHEGDTMPDHNFNHGDDVEADSVDSVILDPTVITQNAIARAAETHGKEPIYGLPPENDRINRRRQQISSSR